MKNKQFCTMIIVLLLPVYLFSQNNYQVKYKMITLFDGIKNYEASLRFSEQRSCFEYKLSIKDTATVESQDENGNFNIAFADTKEYKLYFDFKKRKCSEIKYLKKLFVVQDTLTLPNWKILDEVKNINNHSCQKATTIYKGRNYEVWFTLDYPAKFGPWKLNGLPGLILLAEDDTKEVYFEATEIINITDIIEEPNITFEVVSVMEYDLYFKNWLKDFEERIKSKGDRNLKLSVKFGKAVGIEILD